jgi:hypothetical protein
MFDRIVVAWDGSPRSAAGVDWSLARPGVRRLTLVRVLEEGGPATGNEPMEAHAALERASLDAEVARLRGTRPGVQIRGEFAVGDVERELARRAVRGSLLVLGVAGPEALRFPMPVGLAARLVPDTEGPLALVPVGAADKRGEVVVGVDGTAASWAAAEIAAGEAIDRGQPLVVLHVWWEGQESVAGHSAPRRLLDSSATGVALRFPQLLVRERLVHGDAVQELARGARAGSVLVLGRHEAGAGGRSVAHDIVTRIDAPIIFVRDSDALDASDGARASTP